MGTPSQRTPSLSAAAPSPQKEHKLSCEELLQLARGYIRSANEFTSRLEQGLSRNDPATRDQFTETFSMLCEGVRDLNASRDKIESHNKTIKPDADQQHSDQVDRIRRAITRLQQSRRILLTTMRGEL